MALKTVVDKARDERGQTLVEYAVVFPFLLAITAAIIHFSMMMFGFSMIDSDCVRVQYSISESEAKACTSETAANDLIKEKLLATDALLDPERLTVTGGKVTYRPTTRHLDTGDAEFEEYGIAVKYEHSHYVLVDADVRYEPVPVFGDLFGQQAKTVRIEASNVTSITFELA